MEIYRITTSRQFGDKPIGYIIEVASATTPTQNAQYTVKEIIGLGFKKQVQSNKTTGNLKIEKIGLLYV